MRLRAGVAPLEVAAAPPPILAACARPAASVVPVHGVVRAEALLPTLEVADAATAPAVALGTDVPPLPFLLTAADAREGEARVPTGEAAPVVRASTITALLREGEGVRAAGPLVRAVAEAATAMRGVTVGGAPIPLADAVPPALLTMGAVIPAPHPLREVTAHASPPLSVVEMAVWRTPPRLLPVRSAPCATPLGAVVTTCVTAAEVGASEGAMVAPQ